jgi:tRNA pseudouridine38-40 synthase
MRVHGLMQVALRHRVAARAQLLGARHQHLPKDIAVQWAAEVPTAWIPFRACATARRYAYVLLQSPVRPSDHGRWVFSRWMPSTCRGRTAAGRARFFILSRGRLPGQDPGQDPAPHRHPLPPGRTGPMRDGQMECGYWRFEFEGSAFCTT